MRDLAASVVGKRVPQRRRGRFSNLAGFLAVLAVIFAAPAMIARLAVGGDWRQIVASYAIWLGFFLVVLVLPKGGTASEKGGWFAIMAMFTTVVAVPVITLIQRVGSWALLALN